MTPMQQCHALVKVCPTLFRIDSNGSVWWMREGYETITDPLNDLNAVYAAESTLIPNKWNEYVRKLHWIVSENISREPQLFTDAMVGLACHATAKQRVEALLRTYGEWKE